MRAPAGGALGAGPPAATVPDAGAGARGERARHRGYVFVWDLLDLWRSMAHNLTS